MRQVFINGKFYAGGLNGVHRVADRLIRELDDILETDPSARDLSFTLLAPTKRQIEPEVRHIRVVEEPRGHSQIWEQFLLPRRARGGVLVNLCNLAPILHGPKLLLLHDAQFLFPDCSYSARQRWGYRLLTPLMARTSAQVLTISEYSRQTLDLCGVSRRGRTDLIPNGADHILQGDADPSVIAEHGLEDRPFVLHFASFKEYKNTKIVFDAFADPRLKDISLVLVGDGAKELAKAGLTPPPQAIFAGRVADTALRALYLKAVCLAFPSKTEGFGLPPVEAMLCDCPVVAAPAGAIPEVCQDAVAYAHVSSPQEWAGAMDRFRSDQDYRQAKISAGRLRAARFTWKAAGKVLFAQVRRLAAA